MHGVWKRWFGGLSLTWPKVIIAAFAAGALTALMARIPTLKYTSLHTITTTLEVWILFGILIVMNSRSNMDAALKCFAFFLSSQPLVYLLQVPFSQLGWGLFGYYRSWFLWTLLCLPMGYIGYWMKKDRWWGYLILLPMLAETAYSYLAYFSDMQFSAPRYALIVLFCSAALVLYPVAIFRNRKIQTAGGAIGAAAVIALTAVWLLDPPVYSLELMGNGETYRSDDTYTAYLADDRYGDVEILYLDAVEDHMLHADLRRAGDTVLTLVSPDGEQTEYELHIERTTFPLTERQ